MAREALVERWGGRAARMSTALALAAMLGGCGESNVVNPTPSPTPTPTPARAVVGIALDKIGIDVGKLPGFQFALVFNMKVTESGGLGANIDYIRLDVFLADGTALERTQLGSGQIPGGNRLAASAARDFTAVSLGFSSEILTGRYVIVSVGTTDDKGNGQVATSGKLIFG